MNNKELKTPKLDMGENTSKIFSGDTESQTNKEVYAETSEFFANTIKERLPVTEKIHHIVDIGSFRGELLSDLLKKLPEYGFQSIAVDINNMPLKKNPTDHKVVADAIALPFEDKSFDIAIMRYVLQWNSPENQRKIISEVFRVVNKFALVEHLGPDSENPEEWREKTTDILDGKEIQKLKRDSYFFASKNELEEWMKEKKINFHCLRSRRIDNASDVYIERYNLSKEDAEKTRDILGDQNYFQQTDWIIFPID